MGDRPDVEPEGRLLGGARPDAFVSLCVACGLCLGLVGVGVVEALDELDVVDLELVVVGRAVGHLDDADQGAHGDDQHAGARSADHGPLAAAEPAACQQHREQHPGRVERQHDAGVTQPPLERWLAALE